MNLIKKNRKERSWAQTDLSFYSRITASDISKIESGRMKPSVRQIDRLAKAFGIAPEQLMNESIEG